MPADFGKSDKRDEASSLTDEAARRVADAISDEAIEAYVEGYWEGVGQVIADLPERGHRLGRRDGRRETRDVRRKSEGTTRFLRVDIEVSAWRQAVSLYRLLPGEKGVMVRGRSLHFDCGGLTLVLSRATEPHESTHPSTTALTPATSKDLAELADAAASAGCSVDHRRTANQLNVVDPWGNRLRILRI